MDIFDILLPPFYFMIIIAVAFKYSSNKRIKDPIYKYFLPGLLVKMAGAVALGLIYFYYYKGGDTINYFQTAAGLVDVLMERPNDFFYLYFGKPHYSEYYLLQSKYDFSYWVKDDYAYFVGKCYVPIVLLSGKTYMAAAIITAGICYLPVWRLFKIFVREFPDIKKHLSWSILYVPSVVFWGSGIMKDSITFSAACLYVHGFYWFFSQKQFRLVYIAAFLFASFMLLSIKPYVLFALLPGSTLWFITLRINRVKNAFLRFMITPALIFVGVFLGALLLQSLGSFFGAYSLETIITKASTSQQDLKQSYYGGSTFNIGDYEPTIQGMLSVSHKALFATLFRPTVFDVRNIVMMMSAIENTFILFWCVYLLIKLKVLRFFSLITSHPLLMFSFVFSLFFAFSVGVSISNFGTLVRLKIPCIPFFLSSLVILNHMLNLSKRRRYLESQKQFIPSTAHATSET
jgi:hypothetical protein